MVPPGADLRSEANRFATVYTRLAARLWWEAFACCWFPAVITTAPRRLALPVNDDYPAAVLLALRYVKASEATLAFTRHHDYTCILEFDGPLSQRTRTYLNRLWRQFDDAGIPYTFHWGKMNNLDAQRVLEMYGAASVDAWRNARHALLRTPELRRVFANPFLRQVGLDD